MLTINVTDNLPAVNEFVVGKQKQVRYAGAVALTKTAQDVKVEEREEMRRVFDRPVPYTLNSLFLKPATRDTLEAVVWIKDDRAGSGTPATKYLLPEIKGGPRDLKGFETALQAHGLMPKGWRAVPASAIKLDAYGNVPKGLLVQILSQLRVQMTAGYESRATLSKRSRRNVRKQGVEYFALAKRRGKLLPGIYGRYTFAHGSAVKPMFVFSSGAKYRERFRFYEVGGRVVAARFPGHFAEEYAKAMESAR